MIEEEVDRFLKGAKGWNLVSSSIEKNFKFADFKQAIEFINKVATVAEEENHHPDILLWSWNNVRITLTTHSVKGLSEKDLVVASKVDQASAKLGGGT